MPAKLVTSACEMAWRRLEQPVVAVRGVAPVSAMILPVFPAVIYRRDRRTTRVTGLDTARKLCTERVAGHDCWLCLGHPFAVS